MIPDSSQSPMICIQWPRFGPMHLARIRAAADVFAEEGIRVTALETAAIDHLYKWDQVESVDNFDRIQVFTDQAFEDIQPWIMTQRIIQTLDELQPEAVAINSYGLADARAALYWCRKNRKTAIMMQESKADDAQRNPVREWIKSRIVQLFDSALVGGPPQVRYMQALGIPPDQIHLGYDAVDNDYFQSKADFFRNIPDAIPDLPGLERGADDQQHPFFLTSSRFIRRKNLDGLLKAYAGYRTRCQAERVTPWDLVMLGDGNLRDELHHLADELGLEGLIWAGFQQIEALPAYYARASAFILPSHVDQWGLVINEAMASGLPVLVSTGCGCHETLVEPGVNGFTFPSTDTEELTRLMFTLAHDDTDLSHMQEASRRIVSEWGPERFGAGLWDAYRSGQRRSDRTPNPLGMFYIMLMARISRKATSFHAIES